MPDVKNVYYIVNNTFLPRSCDFSMPTFSLMQLKTASICSPPKHQEQLLLPLRMYIEGGKTWDGREPADYLVVFFIFFKILISTIYILVYLKTVWHTTKVQ